MAEIQKSSINCHSAAILHELAMAVLKKSAIAICNGATMAEILQH